MNETLGLRILGLLLEWTDEEATREYAWIRFISRYKYDGYQDFVAGKRFVESLISWLKQFATLDERQAGYQFVRSRLIYFGAAELNHLVRLAYPETIRPRLARAIASRLGFPSHLVWAQPERADAYRQLLRASLFIGLSDGARLDVFRRANSGVISNEQVVLAPQIHPSKWSSVLRKLKTEQGNDTRFEFIFLLDDFTASGATLVRAEDEDEGGGWTGKLVRFWEDIQPVMAEHLTPDWVLAVHHYIGSSEATRTIELREASIRAAKGDGEWFPSIEFSYGTMLPPSVKVHESRDAAFLALADTYYDPAIQTKHTDIGGENVSRGFGGCGLPVVLEHNTPNNSLALLWAESAGAAGNHPMRPLFRRRQRHT